MKKIRKSFNDEIMAVADARNEKVILFQKSGSVVLDSDIEDVDVRSAIFCQISKDQLKRVMKEAKEIVKMHEDRVIEFFGNRYSHIRQVSSAFLEAFEFKSLSSTNSILKSIALLKRLDEDKRRKPVPRNAPTRFITKPWRPYVFGNSDGTISLRYYD